MSTDTVAVLLCSWQGEHHLPRQLDSLAAQTSPVAVHVHDDASSDATVGIARAHPTVASVCAHPINVGVVRNFERGLQAMLEQDVPYVAIADQDDHWHRDRVERGMQAMRTLEARHGSSAPLLVHSDLRMVDADEREISASFLRFRGYSTSDARNVPVMLGQCGVMGNTCLINRALIRTALPFPRELHMHDWWFGVLAELYGARAFIDAPLVDYRIHTANASNNTGTLRGQRRQGLAARLRARDFRLPFCEDQRVQVLRTLLAGDGVRPALPDKDRQCMADLVSCIEGSVSRPAAVATWLGGGYLRRSPAHRLRVAAAQLITKRYPRAR